MFIIVYHKTWKFTIAFECENQYPFRLATSTDHHHLGPSFAVLIPPEQATPGAISSENIIPQVSYIHPASPKPTSQGTQSGRLIRMFNH